MTDRRRRGDLSLLSTDVMHAISNNGPIDLITNRLYSTASIALIVSGLAIQKFEEEHDMTASVAKSQNPVFLRDLTRCLLDLELIPTTDRITYLDQHKSMS